MRIVKEVVIAHPRKEDGWKLKFCLDSGGLTIFQKNQHRSFVKFVCLNRDDIDVLRGML